ncbi:MAG: polysaccharide deacetylase family protein, partial [Candidatus Diapherotrites archaeon]|nr:polysaccharide deacetylase family protein [Candidatus Diapherotrites archaeon]
MKRFCFRFDVDSENCIRNGVPRLLGLGRELGVKFTFFLNMGKAVNRKAYISKIIGSKGSSQVPKLPNIEKLGKKNFIRLALLNPLTCSANKKIVEMIKEDGHEIGLHGGKNHSTWMHNALKWDSKRIEIEIGWGAREIKKILGEPPLGFAAPGFAASDRIHGALKAKGFLYCSDAFGDKKIFESGGLK